MPAHRRGTIPPRRDAPTADPLDNFPDARPGQHGTAARAPPAGDRAPVAAIHGRGSGQTPAGVAPTAETSAHGPISHRRPRQHLFQRGVVARAPFTPPAEPSRPCRRNPRAAQSDCWGSPGCARMLSRAATGLPRSAMVVPGAGSDSACLRARGRAVPPLRSRGSGRNPAHHAIRTIELCLSPLPEMTASAR